MAEEMKKSTSIKTRTITKDKPLKILMLSWEFPPRIVGGLARHVGELSLAMAKAGMEVDVITAYVEGEPAHEVLWPKRASDNTGRLEVHRTPPETIHPLDFVASIHQLEFSMLMRAMGLEKKYDIIHAHDWLVAQAAWTLKQGWQRPMVCTIHATEHGRQHGIYTPLQSYINANEWLLSYEACRVICCSEFMADEINQVLAVPMDKIHAIPNGVDPGRMKLSKTEQENLEEIREEWAAPEEKLVLFVGRMVPEKGAQVLLEAAPRVLTGWPKTRFVIVGGGKNSHLINQAEALGIKDKVNFAGFVSEDDLRKLYGVADVAVFPSLYEPFGIVALEAMATCTPVITSDIGGFREVIRHGENGLQAWANNADSLAWGIVEVFEKPREAQIRAEIALKELKTSYSWAKIAKETLKVYRECL